MSVKRKICVVTANRADYSRLKTLLRALKKRRDIDLALFVIGSHLLSSYGETVKEIEKDGFPVAYRMHTEIDGRVPVTMAKSTGSAITELANAFYNFQPDVVVVHGDRYEALAAATAASLMNIFVAHIQGGEVTGTIDEHIRHAITKLAHVHFPSTEDARERIIRMGEDAKCVHAVGCPASDLLLETPKFPFDRLKRMVFPLAKKEEWKKKFNRDFFLLVYHPVTTEFASAEKNIAEVFAALRRFRHSLVILWPNIDAGGEKLVQAIKKFEREGDGLVGVFPNFSFEVYANILRQAKVMIGNSSSGIREACYFGTPVVDIGTRQSGRERANNVITTPYNRHEIEKAIKIQLKKGRYEPQYLYGNGGAGEKIAEVLAAVEVGEIQKRISY